MPADDAEWAAGSPGERLPSSRWMPALPHGRSALQSRDAMHPEPDITQLIQRWNNGDEGVLGELIELTYPRLRQIARNQLHAGDVDPTIDTTALVHEAYLRLAPEHKGAWPSRAHFFAFCSTVMRRVLIDYARRRQATKRGGALMRVPLGDNAAVVDDQAMDLLQVEQAVETIARHNPRMARVVECRFYGGLSIEETAEALGTSPRTVVREWTRARAYLLWALGHDESAATAPPLA